MRKLYEIIDILMKIVKESLIYAKYVKTVLMLCLVNKNQLVINFQRINNYE